MARKNGKDPIVERVIKLAGGGAELAKKLGLQRQAIYMWRRIPAQHVMAVSKLTGIEPAKLNPIFRE